MTFFIFGWGNDLSSYHERYWMEGVVGEDVGEGGGGGGSEFYVDDGDKEG
ncbi:hypothetical protein A2U01_0035742 [Trifolium medium]|uniref:Uncharacterized protein n=1 Tax=Trifolium medium TaxID=97028 RepID=A0A392PT35_9FABA|nr:hypothetical protein [Trifolium medium]